jgi:hypothetical protein
MKRYRYGMARHTRTGRRLPVHARVVYLSQTRSRPSKRRSPRWWPIGKQVLVALAMSGALVVCGALGMQHVTHTLPPWAERRPVPQVVQPTRVVIVQDDTLPPVMQRIAQCESRGQHLTSTGQVTRGKRNPHDTGLFQINTVVWGKKSEELGYDIRTQEGNEHMARYLFAHYGSVPWQSSAACWNRLS